MKCHICNYWTPEGGCRHYMPDPYTVLTLAGYEVITTKGRVKIKRGNDTIGKKRGYDSFSDAANHLIHHTK